MAASAFVPLVVFVLIGGSVGIRLIGLWRRTREAPELSLGGGLLAVSVALPLTALGRIPSLAMLPSGRILFALGLAAVGIGVGAIVYFHYWVFRRDARWGGLLFALLCALLAGSIGGMAGCNFTGESLETIKATMRPAALTLLGTIGLCFAWGSVESTLYYGAARRQLAIGLGDPIVANRFLLWGVAGGTCALLLAAIAYCAAVGMTILQEPLPLAIIAVCGTLMSATWGLTFFAPEAYLRLVRERAAAGS